jgi:glycosyl transferase family 25
MRYSPKALHRIRRSPKLLRKLTKRKGSGGLSRRKSRKRASGRGLRRGLRKSTRVRTAKSMTRVSRARKPVVRKQRARVLRKTITNTKRSSSVPGRRTSMLTGSPRRGSLMRSNSRGFGRRSARRMMSHSRHSAVSVRGGTAKWPDKFSEMFVITIRRRRWADAQRRLKFLGGNLHKIQGTDGRVINKKAWRKSNKVGNPRMRRGQIGCFESHRRIWEHVAKSNIPYAVIFEDDVDLRPQHLNTIAAAYKQMEEADPDWEILFLSRSRLKRPTKRKVSKNLVVPGTSWGCFAYVVSQKAAKKLCAHALPMRRALDVYVFQQTPRMRAYAVHPSLFHVVPVRSDTKNIK